MNGRAFSTFTVSRAAADRSEHERVGTLSSIDIQTKAQTGREHIRQVSVVLMPLLFQVEALPVSSFSTGRAKRLVRFFLISSSDRRVLDELDPDSTQTARDRQPIHNRPEGELFTPRSHRRPVITIQSIHGQTSNRLANPRPARLAFKLEAQLSQSTILSHVFRHPEDPIICLAELKSAKTFERSIGSTGSWQTFQETSTTQWQKN